MRFVSPRRIEIDVNTDGLMIFIVLIFIVFAIGITGGYEIGKNVERSLQPKIPTYVYQDGCK